MRQPGFTVWLTGLPCSGKSTLAHHLQRTLDEIGFAVEIIDGDEVRKNLTKGLGFSKEDREENIKRITYVAKLLTNVGAVAIVAAISPYRDSRQHAREQIGKFVEVYVDCPLQVCMERDVKGLYAKAKRGEISNFTGISDPYEAPNKAEIIVNTDKDLPHVNIERILDQLVRLHLVPADLIKRLTEYHTTALTI